MSKASRYMPGIIFILILCSCADQITSQCEDAIPAGLQPKLSSIQQFIFTPSCAVTGCHSAADQQQGLNLSSDNAHSNLVNVTSTEDGVLKRVEAGNSTRSWLMKKLNGDGTSVMPPAGQLTQAMIDTVGQWIDAGALNN